MGPDNTALSDDLRAGFDLRFGTAFPVPAFFRLPDAAFFLLAGAFREPVFLAAGFLRATGFFLAFFLLTFFPAAFFVAVFFFADFFAVTFFRVDFFAAGFLRAAVFFFAGFFAVDFFLVTFVFLPAAFFRPAVFLGTVFLRAVPAFLRFLLAAFLAGIVDSCRSEKNAGLYIGYAHMEA